MRFSYPPKLLFKKPVLMLAFGFGSGLPRVAPGTWGSLAALLVYGLFLSHVSLTIQWLLIAISFVLGIWICERSTQHLNVEDHPGIVWDEWVGLWLALTLVPDTWIGWLAGFMAFRLFDIVKPGPIGWLDKRLHGGLGIMLDDVLAGLLAGLVVALIVFLFPG